MDVVQNNVFTYVEFPGACVDVAESSLYGDRVNVQLCPPQHVVDSWLRPVLRLKVEICRPHVQTFLLLAAHTYGQ